jgi:hypothetical protein
LTGEARSDAPGPRRRKKCRGQVAGGRCLFDFTCKRGETIDLSAFLAFEADGRAVVNGETLDPAFIVSGPAMQIQTGPVTIPKGNRRSLTLSVPFTIAEPGAPLDTSRGRKCCAGDQYLIHSGFVYTPLLR